MNKEKFKYKHDLSDFVKAGVAIGIALTFISLIYWLIFTTTDSTIYTFTYKEAQELYEDSSIGLFETDYPQCDFPECDSVAHKKLYLDPLFSNIVPKGIEVFSNMPNKAGFKFCPDSFTYTEKNEHTVYDKGTYLVPQGDGSFRIEVKNDKYVVHTNGGTKTLSTISYEGNYCDTHLDKARSIWYEEIEEIFKTKNVGYYYFEYGLWISLALIPIAALIGCLVYYSCYAIVSLKSNRKKW